MQEKLTKADKEYLHSVTRNKGYDMAAHFIGYGMSREDIDYILTGSADVKFENRKQRQEWLAGAMERLEERLSPEDVKAVRERSACCLGGQRAELAKAIHDAYSTVEERFDAFAKTRYIVGDTAYRTADGAYRVCFRETPPEKDGCSCLRYVPRTKPMSKTWCLCCGGHIKTHFENALGVKAECECISSRLSSCGKEPCIFELRVTEVL